MEIDRIVEFADNILTNNDIIQKRNGLANLIKKVLNDFPDTIPFVENSVSNFPNWRYAQYKDEIYMGYIRDTKKKMLTYINEHFSEITRYENDSEADLEVRKRKLQEYAQVVSIQPSVKRVIRHMGVRDDTEIEYEYSPDRIYVQNGIYRRYWNYKNDSYFIFVLYLRKTFDKYNFLDLSKKVFLYISLKNELKHLIQFFERTCSQRIQLKRGDTRTCTIHDLIFFFLYVSGCFMTLLYKTFKTGFSQNCTQYIFDNLRIRVGSEYKL